MECEKYLRRSRLFPGLRSGPHGQLVERYAARLVGDGLVRHGTWRCCNVVGGLLSWIASRGCALADLVLGISIPASILLRCRRYCSTLRSSSWRGVRARVFCARRSPAGQTPTRISPGGGIQSPLPLSLSVAKRAGLGSAAGDFVRRHRLHQRAPRGHKLGGRGARRLPSHRGRGGGPLLELTTTSENRHADAFEGDPVAVPGRGRSPGEVTTARMRGPTPTRILHRH